jgi:NAD(P)-dependent dehydrogenase (short-subunit alcohol dehydrogenase family)
MNSSAQEKFVPNKVLVTGASGLLGVAAIEKFLSAGCKVVGVSRRKPELPKETARAAFEPLTDITRIAYTALHEKPELVAGLAHPRRVEHSPCYRCLRGNPPRER